jgi:multiple sugar transport system substrate-binding protein
MANAPRIRRRVVVPGLLAAAVAAPARRTWADAPGNAVTIWVGSWWQSQVPVALQLWKADHADIALNVEPLPINGYFDKFTASALGGAPPDVIDLDSSWVSTLAAQGLLQPLGDLAAHINVADISPAIWAAGLFKGTPYAVPSRGGTEVWYYNKTVFDRANVPYPTESWNHDDLVRIARALTIPGVQYGIGMAADISDPLNVMSLFAPILWYFGSDFLTLDGRAPAINSANGVTAITYWADFYVKYGAAPEGTPNFAGTRDVQPLFVANKVGMMPNGQNQFDALLQEPAVKWGVVTAPDRVNRAGGWTMGVPAGAKNPEGAKLFLKWLARPEIQAKVMNRFPANLSARKLPPWDDPKYAIFIKAEPDARSLPAVPGWFQIQNTVITALQKVLVRQSTPQQAADDMAAQIKTIIADNT